MSAPATAPGLLPSLLAVQQELPKLQKDAINPHFKNRYISLDGLMAAIRPVLSKHGLLWVTQPCRDESGPALRYRLLHAASGESIDGTMPLMMAKSDPQGQGSAITYARRYSITAVLGLVADEDDDGHKATQGARNGQAAANGALSREDLASLVSAAKGLKAAQIKLAFAAAGLDQPERVDGSVFQRVPKAKAAELCLALSQTEREA